MYFRVAVIDDIAAAVGLVLISFNVALLRLFIILLFLLFLLLPMLLLLMLFLLLPMLLLLMLFLLLPMLLLLMLFLLLLFLLMLPLWFLLLLRCVALSVAADVVSVVVSCGITVLEAVLVIFFILGPVLAPTVQVCFLTVVVDAVFVVVIFTTFNGIVLVVILAQWLRASNIFDKVNT